MPLLSRFGTSFFFLAPFCLLGSLCNAALFSLFLWVEQSSRSESPLRTAAAGLVSRIPRDVKVPASIARVFRTLNSVDSSYQATLPASGLRVKLILLPPSRVDDGFLFYRNWRAFLRLFPSFVCFFGGRDAGNGSALLLVHGV